MNKTVNDVFIVFKFGFILLSCDRKHIAINTVSHSSQIKLAPKKNF